MKTYILIAGAAMVLSASPGVAGGGGLLGGVTGNLGATLGGTVQNTLGGVTGSVGNGGVGNCLCDTVNGVLSNAGGLPNSVAGLASGVGNGNGHSVGLAGVVTSATSVAGSVTRGGAGMIIVGAVSASIGSRDSTAPASDSTRAAVSRR